jgi:hypothetical protein
MKNVDWPPKEIERLARSSGKPLEVVCAQAFLAAGWKPRLGSHFEDGLGTIRELDVLAEREELLPPPHNMTVRVRALLSCRGFPPERSPLVYSVSTACVPSFAPRLLSAFRASTGPEYIERFGSLQQLEERSALRLLQSTQLGSARPVVAFDMIERSETVSRKRGDKGSVTVGFARVREGDRQLFGAIDSCVKATLFWLREDFQVQQPIFFATLNVPICVFSVPFWDVCIDGGKVAQSEIRHRGYLTHRYPSGASPREVMALLWTDAEISPLIEQLNNLFAWFCVEFRKTGFGGPPLPSSIP